MLGGGVEAATLVAALGAGPPPPECRWGRRPHRGATACRLLERDDRGVDGPGVQGDSRLLIYHQDGRRRRQDQDSSCGLLHLAKIFPQTHPIVRVFRSPFGGLHPPSRDRRRRQDGGSQQKKIT